jgi:Tol biopolymer transport system component
VKRQAKAPSAGSTDGNGKGRGLLIAALALAASLAFGAGAAFAASPTVTIDPGPTAQYTTAQVSGTVDPEGGSVVYEIEYSTDQVNWSGLTFAHSAEDADQSDPPQPVSQEFTGLQPGTQYWFRVYATNFADPDAISSEVTATTEPVAKPMATLDPVTTHGETTATFSGEVDTNAPAVLTPAAEAAFETHWQITCNPACPNLTPDVTPNAPATVTVAEGSKTFSVDAAGLEPNTSYEVTLEASNAGGAESDVQTFATDLVAPSVNPGPGRSDGKGGYHLEAALNPRNSAISSCVFEYGPSTAYGQSIPCASNPGAVNKTVFVTAHVTGLTLGIPYHFRVTAANGAGPATSADATFVPTGGSCPNEARREEQESGFLPECRAYEMVTPPFKQGFEPQKPQYSDGAVAYYSTGSFDGNAYGGLGNQYVARRSETGWNTIAMNPPGEPWVFGVEGEGSRDGRTSDFRSVMWWMRPRTEGPGERDVDHRDRNGLYVRRPDGTFSLVAPNPGTSTPETYATTPDLSHVVVGGACFGGVCPPMYEVGGDQVLRPIGVDNTGAPLGSPCVQGISVDGRVVFFGTGDKGGCFRPRARVDDTTTIEMSASQCTRGAGDPGGLCNADANGNPVGFAADGSRAFMTTTQQLVNGDTDEGNDLYACDIPAGTIAPELPVNKCPDLRRLTTGAAGGADVEGVAGRNGSGFSPDGSHIYFVAQGVLAANQGANDETAVAGAHNLYLWETDAEHPEGHIAFLARIENLQDVVDNSTSQTTPDGRYLLVTTSDPLVSSGPAADTDGAADVYRYDSQTGEWLRISTDTTGGGGNAEIRAEDDFRRALTGDGQTVVFQTAEALSPADTNSVGDVYAWHEGRVSLISPDGGADPGISSSGTEIFFTTTSQVTADDTDTNSDVYTARIGGGFDLREPAPPCEGEGCRGPLTTTPSSSAPGSAGSSGGNVKEKPRKCPKGKRKVQGKAGRFRCVPKRSGSKHTTRHHSAGRNGGAHK